MTGIIDDCNVDDAKTRQSSDQASLTSFTDEDETFVGIVRSPNDEMETVTDEIDQRLAPANDLFREWIEKRDELRENGVPYVEAHNQAFDAVNYRARFLASIDYDAIDEYARRIQDGARIVFVCYCSNGCRCHRRIVKNHVHNQIETDV